MLLNLVKSVIFDEIPFRYVYNLLRAQFVLPFLQH